MWKTAPSPPQVEQISGDGAVRSRSMSLLQEECAGRYAEPLAGGGEEMELQALAVAGAGHRRGARSHAGAQIPAELPDALAGQLAQGRPERAEGSRPVRVAARGEKLLRPVGDRLPGGARREARRPGRLEQLGSESGSGRFRPRPAPRLRRKGRAKNCSVSPT